MPHPAQAAEHLEQAFDVFNRMSEQLASSYRELESQVAILNRELAEARSERLQQLAEKEKLADRLARILEMLPGALLVMDAQDEIRQVNAAAGSLMQTELIGKKWADIYEQLFEPSLNNVSEYRLKNGRYVTMLRQSLDSENGHVVLILDVTEQYKLKQMANRQDRLAAMGEMAANLAHQIRTPLSTAMLYSSNLLNQDLTEQSRLRMTGKVVERLRQLEQMVNDLLCFTRDKNYDAEQVSVLDLLSEFGNIIKPQFAEQGGKIYLPELPQDIIINGNAEALLGVLLNLATNSLQACEESPEVIVNLTLDDRYLVIELSDNGPGINKELADKIFTPFFTTRSDGTGLGLAVAQSTISAHKGELRFVKNVQKGACFEIRLPVTGNDVSLPSNSQQTINESSEIGQDTQTQGVR